MPGWEGKRGGGRREERRREERGKRDENLKAILKMGHWQFLKSTDRQTDSHHGVGSRRVLFGCTAVNH